MISDAFANAKDSTVAGTSESPITALVEKELANFDVAIADDLSMPRASACLFSIVKAAEKEFKRVDKSKADGEESAESTLDLEGLKQVQQALDKMDQVFGIYYEVPKAADERSGEEDEADGDSLVVPDEVMELVMQRTAAKDSKDWELADSLRKKITELGFAVKDVKGGDPIVSKV
jgi:cysteinyl-tRNA synthetase